MNSHARTIGILLLAGLLQCASTGAEAQLHGFGGPPGGGLSAPAAALALPHPVGNGLSAGGVGAVGHTHLVPSHLTRPNLIDNDASSPTNSAAGGNAVSRAAIDRNRAANIAGGADPTTVTSGVPPARERRYVRSEVVISLPSSLSESAIDALSRRHRLTAVETQDIPLLGTRYVRWRIADGRDVGEVIRALEADGAVRTAQPNYRFRLLQSPQALGPATATNWAQYAPSRLHVPEAHRFATGEHVLVAVIDSGIDMLHYEIVGAIADQYDVAPAGPPHFHGTAMAGAIVAHVKMMGIAPGARILAVRAFDGRQATPEATTLSIIKGLDWAVARGARVINMSFAGPYDPDMARVLAAARQKGVVLVAAAGNAGPKSPPLFPAADKNVIAVTATNADNQLLPEASRGPYVSVAAPGVDILVPSPGDKYETSTGTSVAAAHVSGIAALLLELQPKLTTDNVRQIVQSTALDLGPEGRDDQYGHGLANAEGAVLALGPTTARTQPATLFSNRWPVAMPLRPWPN